MRWSVLLAAVVALGCGGFGATADEAAEPVADAAAADTDAPPDGDAVADADTGDTADDAEDDDEAPSPAPARGKRKPRAPRPPTAKKPPAPPAPGAPAKKKKAPPQPGPKPEGIEQVSETSWRVARSLVKGWQDDPYRLGNVREKDPGWEVIGVRPKDGWHLGMRNKDLVVEINGHQLRTKPQLLGAYLDLKNDEVFDVTVIRAGVARVHHYEVVGD